MPVDIDPNGNMFYYVYLATMTIVTLIGTIAARNRGRTFSSTSPSQVPPFVEEDESSEQPGIIDSLYPLLLRINDISEMKLSLRIDDRYLQIHIIHEAEEQK